LSIERIHHIDRGRSFQQQSVLAPHVAQFRQAIHSSKIVDRGWKIRLGRQRLRRHASAQQNEREKISTGLLNRTNGIPTEVSRTKESLCRVKRKRKDALGGQIQHFRL
jgi:hypothetical protein